uniref:F-box domain-containing protein n=2 Tax=Talaromyces marneffei PM1 TaxID=1077442 RepID=A0A093VQM8_TALMA
MAALCSPEQGGQGSLLSNLPTEIVIQIMKHSLNFSCLWALVKASSRFSSILMAFAWEIVEEVMIKTTPLCTQILMKIALIIRTSPDIFTGVNDVSDYATERKQLKSFPHQQMSPQVLREFVQLAHNIHAVTHACLDFYLEKLKYLKPQRIHDIDVENHERMLSVLYSEHPLLGQPFQPNLDFGPPTYLEEQRVVRLLWQFQAFLNLKAAGRTHALAHWPERDHNILAKPIVARLIYTIYEKYQIHPVFEFVNEITKYQVVGGSISTWLPINRILLPSKWAPSNHGANLDLNFGTMIDW